MQMNTGVLSGEDQQAAVAVLMEWVDMPPMLILNRMQRQGAEYSDSGERGRSRTAALNPDRPTKFKAACFDHLMDKFPGQKFRRGGMARPGGQGSTYDPLPVKYW